MSTLKDIEEYTWHPTTAECEVDTFFRVTAVYSLFRNMKPKQLKKFYDEHCSEVTVALTKYFLDNYDEYAYIFEPLQFKRTENVTD